MLATVSAVIWYQSVVMLMPPVIVSCLFVCFASYGCDHFSDLRIFRVFELFKILGHGVPVSSHTVTDSAVRGKGSLGCYQPVCARVGGGRGTHTQTDRQTYIVASETSLWLDKGQFRLSLLSYLFASFLFYFTSFLFFVIPFVFLCCTLPYLFFFLYLFTLSCFVLSHIYLLPVFLFFSFKSYFLISLSLLSFFYFVYPGILSSPCAPAHMHTVHVCRCTDSLSDMHSPPLQFAPQYWHWFNCSNLHACIWHQALEGRTHELFQLKEKYTSIV